MGNVLRPLLGAVILTLAGCAAMSKSECQLGNWQTVGFNDGARGALVSRVGDYSQACSKYGVAPDLTAYRSGYDSGLETYCRDGNGFAVGARGAQYEGVCPASLEPKFLEGFRVGHQLFEMQSSVSSLQAQISQDNYQLNECAERLAADQAAVVSDGTTPDQRAQLLMEMTGLAQRQGALQAQVVELERSLAVSQQQLNQFRSTIAYNN